MTDQPTLETNPEVQALRDDIRQTRAELGDTVQALAAKADVKARVRETAAEARERVKESAAQTAAQVRDTAMHTAVQVKDSAAQVKDSAVVAVRRARQRAAGGYSVRQQPAPWLIGVATAGVAAVIMYMVMRGRRS